MVEWRDIPGIPRHQASSDGQIRNLGGDTYRDRWGNVRVVPPCLYSPTPDSDGYLLVSVPDGGKPRKHRAVHKLVLRTFVGPKPDGMQGRHLDGNKRNNAASNLIWGTVQENHDDKRRHGTTARGSRTGNAALTEDDVREIRRRVILGREKQRAVAVAFGITECNVRWILLRKTWAHVDDGLQFIPRRVANPGSFGSSLRR